MYLTLNKTLSVRLLVEPMVTLDISANDLLNCRAGTTIKIPATITGRPVPKVTWTFDGTAETEKKNDLHTLPIDSEVRHERLKPTRHIPLFHQRGASAQLSSSKNPGGQ